MEPPLKFLETAECAAARSGKPWLGKWYSYLADLYRRQLWDELAFALHQFSTTFFYNEQGAIILLYHNFIDQCATKINVKMLAYLARNISFLFSEAEAITFLELVADKICCTGERHIWGALSLIKVTEAEHLFYKGKAKECKELLDDCELGALADDDSSLQAAFYWVSSVYYNYCRDFTQFYKHMLLYLDYVEEEYVPTHYRLGIAFDLAIAALLGENVYDFAELLCHPIMSDLLATDQFWIYYILQTVDTGHLVFYEEIRSMHSVAFNSQLDLVKNEKKLREKLNIRKMQIIFSRPSENQVFSIEAIAKETKLSVEDVEILLMKSLSIHVIEGTIDHVEGTVYISWVRPRALQKSEVRRLCDGFTSWLDKVHAPLQSLQAFH